MTIKICAAAICVSSMCAALSAATFNKDVLPILQKNCQACHRPGQVAPMSLLSYKEARPWAKAIKEAVVIRKMPPWSANPQYGHFINDRSMKQSEIDTLVAWADSGAAEGDPKEAPPPVQWPAEGWLIQPDVVVDLPAHDVPAKGIVEWERLAVKAPFKEDTWITSVEVLPGERSVVHHLCGVFQKHQSTTVYNQYEWMVVPRGEDGASTDRRFGATGRGFEEGTIGTRDVGSTEVKYHTGRPTLPNGTAFCYVPGWESEDYRVWNAARLVPAGSDIILNIHYNPNGRAAVDRSKIGFTIAKTPPPKKFVQLGSGADPTTTAATAGGATPAAAALRKTGNVDRIAIPPYEGNYLATPLDITFQKDVELVWLWAHAHLRGKSAQFKLIYPDGGEEVVLDIPRYDFNWQLAYRTSVKIPKGARMHIEFRYDNSVNNKFNPDPSKWVYEGDQTWEEMMGPGMGFLLDRDADESGITTPFRASSGG
jgi:hypothetical protein